MSDELKFQNSDSLDERTIRAMRDAYAPPVTGEGEAAYWNALEQRIMARVKSGAPARENGWWSVLSGWTQVGLVAAAALLAIGGMVSNKLGEPDETYAYESIIQNGTPEVVSAPAALINASDESSQRDAALQYVLSY
jgi:hypothetical protein